MNLVDLEMGLDGKSCKFLMRKEVEVKKFTNQKILDEVRSVYGPAIEKLEFVVIKGKGRGQAQQGMAPHLPGETTAEVVERLRIEGGLWNEIRADMAEYLNDASDGGKRLDKNWFGELEPIVDEGARVISLKAPSNFIRDWVTNNYGPLIREFCAKSGWTLREIVA